jgi:3-deoxy-manno-octulosonate cytidylyltransferase (CMP-KDO synthetase)
VIPFKVVIPARLGSTRLPRKVLRDLAGKPLLQWVWEAAVAAAPEQVIVAADQAEVLETCHSFGADARLTAASHDSGTDRVDEIARAAGWSDDTLVVNLQGDEPLMPPALIRQAAQLLAEDAAADIATLCHPLHSREEWLNPNVVKLVVDNAGYALYFSRAPIPWKREGTTVTSPLPAGLAFRHIGLYAYRVGALRRFSALPPASLEQCEMLEQLRALSHGLRIKVGVSEIPPPRGVDTADDLAAVAALLAARPQP